MGIVEDVGARVSRLKKGDRVVVPFTSSRRSCWFCEQTMFSLCDTTNPTAPSTSTSSRRRAGAARTAASTPWAPRATPPTTPWRSSTRRRWPYVLQQAIMACREGGTISVPGVYAAAVTLPFSAAMDEGLTFKMGQTHVQRYLYPLLQKIQSGEIDPSFISPTRPRSATRRRCTRRSATRKTTASRLHQGGPQTLTFAGPNARVSSKRSRPVLPGTYLVSIRPFAPTGRGGASECSAHAGRTFG